MNYKKTSEILPEQGTVVMTCIIEGGEIRNEQELKLMHGLWFFPDGSMYVYYTPTHWKECFYNPAQNKLSNGKRIKREYERF